MPAPPLCTRTCAVIEGLCASAVDKIYCDYVLSAIASCNSALLYTDWRCQTAVILSNSAPSYLSVYLSMFVRRFSPLQAAAAADRPANAWRNVSTNCIRSYCGCNIFSRAFVWVSPICLPMIIYPRRCEDISPT